MKITDHMRLLLVVPRIASYRAFLHELCFALNANGTEIHVACSMEAINLQKSAATQDSCVHFHPLDLPRGMHPIEHKRAARQLDALVSELKPDIVDAHFSAAIFTTAL